MASCLLREGRAVIQFCTPASLNLKIHFCLVPIFWVVEDSMTRMGVVGRMRRGLAFEREEAVEGWFVKLPSAFPSDAGGGPQQCDGHIPFPGPRDGWLEWQKATGYGRRSRVETAMGRCKRIVGPQFRARSFGGQRTEAAIGVAVLCRMLGADRPNSVRSFKKST